jgi:hypothetical protein
MSLEEIIVWGGLLLGLGTALWVFATIIEPGMLRYEAWLFDWIYGPDKPPKRQKKG